MRKLSLFLLTLSIYGSAIFTTEPKIEPFFKKKPCQIGQKSQKFPFTVNIKDFKTWRISNTYTSFIYHENIPNTLALDESLKDLYKLPTQYHITFNNGLFLSLEGLIPNSAIPETVGLHCINTLIRDATLDQFLNLRHLSLKYNLFESIPNTNNLPLEELTVQGNLIKTIDADYLPTTLKHLDVSDNELEDFPIEAVLEKCPSLCTLWIYFNKFSDETIEQIQTAVKASRREILFLI